MSILINIIGWIAVAIGSAMYAPQTFKVVRAKSSKGLSPITFSLALFGTGMWMYYMGSLGDFTLNSAGWAANVIVGLLMLPIIYYIFKDRMFLRFFAYAWITAAFATSLIWFIMGFKAQAYLQMIFVICAGTATSFGFIPQIIKIREHKAVDNLSIWLILLYATTNGLWSVYWIMIIIHEPNSTSVPSEIISCALDGVGFFVQFYLCYLVIKYRHNKPHTNSQ